MDFSVTLKYTQKVVESFYKSESNNIFLLTCDSIMERNINDNIDNFHFHIIVRDSADMNSLFKSHLLENTNLINSKNKKEYFEYFKEKNLDTLSENSKFDKLSEDKINNIHTHNKSKKDNKKEVEISDQEKEIIFKESLNKKIDEFLEFNKINVNDLLYSFLLDFKLELNQNLEGYSKSIELVENMQKHIVNYH